MDPEDPQQVPEDGDLDGSDDAESGEDESGSGSSEYWEEPGFVYSQDEAVAAFTDYFEFLTKMYLDESFVACPPPGGWSDIVNANPAVQQALGKTDEVMSLMAHLPYIRFGGNYSSDAHAVPECSFEDWRRVIRQISAAPGLEDMRERARDIRNGLESPEFAPFAPAHFFGIAHSLYADGIVIVLDTKLGLMHWDGYSCPDIMRWDAEENGRGSTRVDMDWERIAASKEESNWLGSAPAWTIPEFFANLKYLLTNLDWIPISPQTLVPGRDNEIHEAGRTAMLKEIYRQHGWPDLAVYRKAECIAAVRKAMDEKYPHSACWRNCTWNGDESDGQRWRR